MVMPVAAKADDWLFPSIDLRHANTVSGVIDDQLVGLNCGGGSVVTARRQAGRCGAVAAAFISFIKDTSLTCRQPSAALLREFRRRGASSPRRQIAVIKY
jgi:hypothetical protein